MIEEAIDIGRDVERAELVDRVWRQPLARDGGRGNGRRGEDDVEAFAGQPADQRQDRVGLADAGGMDPDDAAGGARADAWP